MVIMPRIVFVDPILDCISKTGLTDRSISLVVSNIFNLMNYVSVFNVIVT